MKPHKLNEEQIDEIVKLFREQVPVAELASLYHVSEPTIRARLNERGVDTGPGRRKRCAECGEAKRLVLFPVDHSCKSGRTNRCKVCVNAGNRLRRLGIARQRDPTPEQTFKNEQRDREIQRRREEQRAKEVDRRLRENTQSCLPATVPPCDRS